MRLAYDIGCPMYLHITNGKHGEAADMFKNADIYRNVNDCKLRGSHLDSVQVNFHAEFKKNKLNRVRLLIQFSLQKEKTQIRFLLSSASFRHFYLLKKA